MEKWLKYKRKGVTEIRPYEQGENLSKISISNQELPKAGGMIARNPNHPQDQWYMDKKYFEENYELDPSEAIKSNKG